MPSNFYASSSSIKESHRRAFFPLYLPSLLFGMPGQAAFILLPLCVMEMGGTPSAAAAVIGFKGLGMMVCDIPAGKIAGRIGNRRTMQLAAMLVGFSFFCYSFCDSVILFWLVAFIHGCGSSTFLVGRMSFLAERYPVNQRGRVIAMIAGSLRLTALLGPLAGGLLVEVLDFKQTFLICSFLFYLVVLCINKSGGREVNSIKRLPLIGTTNIIRTYQKIFVTAGSAAIVFMLMRAARTVLIPIQ